MNESMNPLPQWLSGKEPTCSAEKWVRFLVQEDPLEEMHGNPLQKKKKSFLSIRVMAQNLEKVDM